MLKLNIVKCWASGCRMMFNNDDKVLITSFCMLRLVIGYYGYTQRVLSDSGTVRNVEIVCILCVCVYIYIYIYICVGVNEINVYMSVPECDE